MSEVIRMSEALPKFDAPPVIETALSVQFARLPGFSTALAGWFWKSYLAKTPGGENWIKLVETARLEDQFERFGADETWAQLGIRLGPAGESQRTQIIRSGEERMIQVQDSRFVLNWRKQGGGYPSFVTLSEEFWKLYPAFEQFVSDAAMGPLEPNQWEVTYVNHIPKGEMWQSPREWNKIIPSLSFPAVAGPGILSDTLSSDWRFSISSNRGRLYVGLRHARIAPANDEVTQLTLTARGPIDSSKGWDARQGFDVGHETIVRSFTAMTSAEAHRIWKRRV